jgi:hypothetical protein
LWILNIVLHFLSEEAKKITLLCKILELYQNLIFSSFANYIKNQIKIEKIYNLLIMISCIIITNVSKISKRKKGIQIKSKPSFYISYSNSFPIIDISIILFKWLSKISYHIHKIYSIQPYFQCDYIPLRFFFKTYSVNKIVNDIEAPKKHPILIVVKKFAFCRPIIF